jgi:hypothetical protein
MQFRFQHFLKVLSLLVLFNLVNCSTSTAPDFDLISPQNLSEQDFEKRLSEFPLVQLNDLEISGLIFMREEEKLARDVYLNLYKKHPLRPFKNISRSEQAHMNAIKVLLDRHKIEDPVAEDIQGVFKNDSLQQMYNQLILKGSESEIEALKVGCAIEEIDIIDLQNELDKNVESPDVKFVYTNLKRASGYHLKAFVWNLKRRGVIYEPQYLDLKTYNSIVNPKQNDIIKFDQ